MDGVEYNIAALQHHARGKETLKSVNPYGPVHTPVVDNHLSPYLFLNKQFTDLKSKLAGDVVRRLHSSDPKT